MGRRRRDASRRIRAKLFGPSPRILAMLMVCFSLFSATESDEIRTYEISPAARGGFPLVQSSQYPIPKIVPIDNTDPIRPWGVVYPLDAAAKLRANMLASIGRILLLRLDEESRIALGRIHEAFRTRYVPAHDYRSLVPIIRGNILRQQLYSVFRLILDTELTSPPDLSPGIDEKILNSLATDEIRSSEVPSTFGDAVLTVLTALAKGWMEPDLKIVAALMLDLANSDLTNPEIPDTVKYVAEHTGQSSKPNDPIFQYLNGDQMSGADQPVKGVLERILGSGSSSPILREFVRLLLKNFREVENRVGFHRWNTAHPFDVVGPDCRPRSINAIAKYLQENSDRVIDRPFDFPSYAAELQALGSLIAEKQREEDTRGAIDQANAKQALEYLEAFRSPCLSEKLRAAAEMLGPYLNDKLPRNYAFGDTRSGGNPYDLLVNAMINFRNIEIHDKLARVLDNFIYHPQSGGPCGKRSIPYGDRSIFQREDALALELNVYSLLAKLSNVLQAERSSPLLSFLAKPNLLDYFGPGFNTLVHTKPRALLIDLLTKASEKAAVKSVKELCKALEASKAVLEEEALVNTYSSKEFQDILKVLSALDIDPRYLLMKLLFRGENLFKPISPGFGLAGLETPVQHIAFILSTMLLKPIHKRLEESIGFALANLEGPQLPTRTFTPEDFVHLVNRLLRREKQIEAAISESPIYEGAFNWEIAGSGTLENVLSRVLGYPIEKLARNQEIFALVEKAETMLEEEASHGMELLNKKALDDVLQYLPDTADSRPADLLLKTSNLATFLPQLDIPSLGNHQPRNDLISLIENLISSSGVEREFFPEKKLQMALESVKKSVHPPANDVSSVAVEDFLNPSASEYKLPWTRFEEIIGDSTPKNSGVILKQFLLQLAEDGSDPELSEAARLALQEIDRGVSSGMIPAIEDSEILEASGLLPFSSVAVEDFSNPSASEYKLPWMRFKELIGNSTPKNSGVILKQFLLRLAEDGSDPKLSEAARLALQEIDRGVSSGMIPAIEDSEIHEASSLLPYSSVAVSDFLNPSASEYKLLWTRFKELIGNSKLKNSGVILKQFLLRLAEDGSDPKLSEAARLALQEIDRGVSSGMIPAIEDSEILEASGLLPFSSVAVEDFSNPSASEYKLPRTRFEELIGNSTPKNSGVILKQFLLQLAEDGSDPKLSEAARLALQEIDRGVSSGMIPAIEDSEILEASGLLPFSSVAVEDFSNPSASEYKLPRTRFEELIGNSTPKNSGVILKQFLLRLAEDGSDPKLSEAARLALQEIDRGVSSGMIPAIEDSEILEASGLLPFSSVAIEDFSNPSASGYKLPWTRFEELIGNSTPKNSGVILKQFLLQLAEDGSDPKLSEAARLALQEIDRGVSSSMIPAIEDFEILEASSLLPNEPTFYPSKMSPTPSWIMDIPPKDFQSAEYPGREQILPVISSGTEQRPEVVENPGLVSAISAAEDSLVNWKRDAKRLREIVSILKHTLYDPVKKLLRPQNLNKLGLNFVFDPRQTPKQLLLDLLHNLMLDPRISADSLVLQVLDGSRQDLSNFGSDSDLLWVLDDAGIPYDSDLAPVRLFLHAKASTGRLGPLINQLNSDEDRYNELLRLLSTDKHVQGDQGLLKSVEELKRIHPRFENPLGITETDVMDIIDALPREIVARYPAVQILFTPDTIKELAPYHEIIESPRPVMTLLLRLGQISMVSRNQMLAGELFEFSKALGDHLHQPVISGYHLRPLLRELHHAQQINVDYITQIIDAKLLSTLLPDGLDGWENIQDDIELLNDILDGVLAQRVVDTGVEFQKHVSSLQRDLVIITGGKNGGMKLPSHQEVKEMLEFIPRSTEFEAIRYLIGTKEAFYLVPQASGSNKSLTPLEKLMKLLDLLEKHSDVDGHLHDSVLALNAHLLRNYFFISENDFGTLPDAMDGLSVDQDLVPLRLFLTAENLTAYLPSGMNIERFESPEEALSLVLQILRENEELKVDRSLQDSIAAAIEAVQESVPSGKRKPNRHEEEKVSLERARYDLRFILNLRVTLVKALPQSSSSALKPTFQAEVLHELENLVPNRLGPNEEIDETIWKVSPSDDSPDPNGTDLEPPVVAIDKNVADIDFRLIRKYLTVAKLVRILPGNFCIRNDTDPKESLVLLVRTVLYSLGRTEKKAIVAFGKLLEELKKPSSPIIKMKASIKPAELKSLIAEVSSAKCKDIGPLDQDSREDEVLDMLPVRLNLTLFRTRKLKLSVILKNVGQHPDPTGLEKSVETAEKRVEEMRDVPEISDRDIRQILTPLDLNQRDLTALLENCKAPVLAEHLPIDFGTGEAKSYKSKVAAVIDSCEKLRFKNVRARIALNKAKALVKKLPPPEITREEFSQIFGEICCCNFTRVKPLMKFQAINDLRSFLPVAFDFDQESSVKEKLISLLTALRNVEQFQTEEMSSALDTAEENALGLPSGPVLSQRDIDSLKKLPAMMKRPVNPFRKIFVLDNLMKVVPPSFDINDYETVESKLSQLLRYSENMNLVKMDDNCAAALRFARNKLLRQAEEETLDLLGQMIKNVEEHIPLMIYLESNKLSFFDGITIGHGFEYSKVEDRLRIVLKFMTGMEKIVRSKALVESIDSLISQLSVGQATDYEISEAINEIPDSKQNQNLKIYLRCQDVRKRTEGLTLTPEHTAKRILLDLLKVVKITTVDEEIVTDIDRTIADLQKAVSDSEVESLFKQIPNFAIHPEEVEAIRSYYVLHGPDAIFGADYREVLPSEVERLRKLVEVLLASPDRDEDEELETEVEYLNEILANPMNPMNPTNSIAKFLDTIYDPSIHGRGFDRQAHTTRGSFLKALLEHLLANPDVQQDIKRHVKSPINHVRSDGPGAESVDGNEHTIPEDRLFHNERYPDHPQADSLSTLHSTPEYWPRTRDYVTDRNSQFRSGHRPRNRWRKGSAADTTNGKRTASLLEKERLALETSLNRILNLKAEDQSIPVENGNGFIDDPAELDSDEDEWPLDLVEKRKTLEDGVKRSSAFDGVENDSRMIPRSNTRKIFKREARDLTPSRFSNKTSFDQESATFSPDKVLVDVEARINEPQFGRRASEEATYITEEEAAKLGGKKHDPIRPLTIDPADLPAEMDSEYKMIPHTVSKSLDKVDLVSRKLFVRNYTDLRHGNKTVKRDLAQITGQHPMLNDSQTGTTVAKNDTVDSLPAPEALALHESEPLETITRKDPELESRQLNFGNETTTAVKHHKSNRQSDQITVDSKPHQFGNGTLGNPLPISEQDQAIPKHITSNDHGVKEITDDPSSGDSVIKEERLSHVKDPPSIKMEAVGDSAGRHDAEKEIISRRVSLGDDYLGIPIVAKARVMPGGIFHQPFPKIETMHGDSFRKKRSIE